MAKKIKPTNHDSWLLHFHVGKRHVPLTVYLMDDGTYQVWFGSKQHLNLTRKEAGNMLGTILLSNQGVTL